MNVKMRLIAALAAAAVMPFALGACGGGPECGDNTTEQDGVCVPNTVDSPTCAGGTVLSDGECVLDESSCGEGTTYADGECVPEELDAEELCGEGTEYDESADACVPSSDISCGDGTTEEGNSCVPDPDAVCQNGTLNEEGLCVVDPANCGENTMLDPTSNTCVVSDTTTYCGDNTAYDADADACVPTEDVCDDGTTYSEDTGLCLPEATCQMGDVIVDGKCTSPLREVFTNADLSSDEIDDRIANNDDPSTGGAATDLTLPAMGTAYTVGGQINAPIDLDGDGEADQDYDAYSITATAGQFFDVSVQPLAGTSLSFMLMSEDGDYQRFSTFGFGSGAQRGFLIPTDGNYTLVVAPSIVLASDGAAGPVGADEWDYVLQVEELSAPTPTTVDTSANDVTGSFADLSDNLFQATNLTGGPVSLTLNDVGADADGVLHIWSSPTELVATYDIETGDTIDAILPQGDVYLFFDWRTAIGPDLGFDLSAASSGTISDLGDVAAGGTSSSTPATLPDGDTVYVSVNIEAGEAAEVSHTNAEDAALDVELFAGPTFVTAINNFDVVDEPDYAYLYTPTATTYTFALTNDTGADVTDLALTVNSLTPNPLGNFGVGDTLSATQPNDVGEARREYHDVTFTENVQLNGTITNPNGDDLDVRLLDASTGDVLQTLARFGGEDLEEVNLLAGDYVIEIVAFEELTGGYEVDVTTSVPPNIEAEPNDTIADATMTAADAQSAGTFTDGDVDVFSFDLAADLAADEVWIAFVETDTGRSDSRSYTCRLLDSAGTELLTETSANECALFAQGLTMGTYYLEVSTDASSSIDYLITPTLVSNADVEVEPNDTDMTATPYTVGTTMFGRMALNDSDVDYFAVTIPAGINANDEITFTMSAGEEGDEFYLNKDATSSVNIAVYDSALNELDATTGFSADPNTVATGTGLTPGETYYVAITRDSNDDSYTGRYYFESEVVLGPVPLAGGETCTAATPITASGTYTDTLSGFTDDYAPTTDACTGTADAAGNDAVYSIDLAAGQLLEASLVTSADGLLYLVDDCTDIDNACLAGDGGFTNEIIYLSPVAQTVNLIVDGETTMDNDSFELEIELSTPADAGTLSPGSGGAATSPAATIPADQKAFASVDAIAGEVLELWHINDGNNSLDVDIFSPEGYLDTITGFGVVTVPEYAYLYTPAAGTYQFLVDNDTGADVTNFELTANNLTPNALGSFGVGDTIAANVPTLVEEARRDYHTFTLTEEAELDGTISNPDSDDLDVLLLDATTGDLLLTSAVFGDETISETLPAGDYLLAIAAFDPLTNGYEVNLTVSTPPAAPTQLDGGELCSQCDRDHEHERGVRRDSTDRLHDRRLRP